TVGSVFPEDQLDDVDGGLLTTGAVANGLQIQFFSDADFQNKGPGSGSPSFASYTVISIGGSVIFQGWDTPDVPLLPETAFVIRNGSSAELQYVEPGEAPDHPVAYLVPSGVSRDSHLGSGYPATVTVEETGLGAGITSRQLFTQGTALNSAPGQGGAIVSYLGFLGIWDVPTTPLDPFGGFVFRQEAADAGGKVTVTKPY
ncbi:MAG: hypothetical protein ACPGYV_01975, partial [Phycisphaeraceae bacterium]